jgi:hypothetical protein
MTMAPLSWGRVMLSKWFGCSDHHGRQAILLRQEKKVLAFPEYSRGNKFLDHDTIELIVQLYLQDGISRMSSNTKDVIKIKDELVSVRFMKMTVYEALRKFYDDYPMTKVGKSSFYSLRPRQVKLNCPHETCMCHIHENMSLLLQVSVSIVTYEKKIFVSLFHRLTISMFKENQLDIYNWTKLRLQI